MKNGNAGLGDNGNGRVNSRVESPPGKESVVCSEEKSVDGRNEG
jgi:hypothetical protein